LGALKNIILKLKNSIKTVRVGKIKSIKSAVTKEGELAKNKCRK